jgi:hypothetical protein
VELAVSAWKVFEDSCAKALGGRRVLGNRGAGVPDSDDDVSFALECKLGYARFSLRDKWIEQARRNAQATGKPWAIVQRPKYTRRAVVTLDFFSFVELAQRAGLIGTVEVGEEEVE